MYDHMRQYRCTIIRGKSKKEMDDLLPVYAMVINEICPCSVDEFDQLFNNAFQRFLPESERTKKTLDNHRTEISGKLFGMYYRASDGMVYESQRTLKFLEDNDQPAFFKDLCYKMQFPNGMDSVHTLQARIAENINFRPSAYILKLLRLAEMVGQPISVKDIGYYILNSLDVLQGKASPNEVLDVIVSDHSVGLQREVLAYDENGKPKASSYTMQHIREQLNYLELANLVRITDDKCLILNSNENETIDLFIKDFDKLPDFNVYSYDFSTVETRREFQYDWDFYFAKLSVHASAFATSCHALSFSEKKQAQESDRYKKAGFNLIELGDEGESLVYEYEKARVASYNARLVNKVLSLGKVKGIGYDIQSVIAEPGDMDEFVKYIEVKSTKRYTYPDLNDHVWMDTLTMTRNEWVAAQQHGQFYYIARVYFTSQGVVMFMISNVAEKLSDGRMRATPMTYRLDFSNSSVDGYVKLRDEKMGA